MGGASCRSSLASQTSNSDDPGRTGPSIRTSFELNHSVKTKHHWLRCAQKQDIRFHYKDKSTNLSQSMMERIINRFITIRGLFLILFSLICVQHAQRGAITGSHTPLPDQYNSENWLIVNEGQNPVQTKQYEITLINKDSIRIQVDPDGILTWPSCSGIRTPTQITMHLPETT